MGLPGYVVRVRDGVLLIAEDMNGDTARIASHVLVVTHCNTIASTATLPIRGHAHDIEIISRPTTHLHDCYGDPRDTPPRCWDPCDRFCPPPGPRWWIALPPAIVEAPARQQPWLVWRRRHQAARS